MSDDFRTSIIDAMNEALDNRRQIPPEQHHDDHEWIRAKINKERERQLFWYELRTKSAPAALTTLATALALWLWNIFKGHWTP